MKIKKVAMMSLILGLVGCTSTTQMDKYNEVRRAAETTCNYKPTPDDVKACDITKPVKPKTSKYIYHNKRKIISDCKDRVNSGIESSAHGIQMAVNFGEMSDRYAMSVINVLVDKAKADLKQCEKVKNSELKTIRKEWVKYEQELNYYKVNYSKCASLRKEQEENNKQCKLLTEKLKETDRGSATWSYLTKSEDVIFKTIASPIMIPLTITSDVIHSVKN
ncbi:hypothetical protein ACPV3S_17445 [Photobacterium damselae]|uniref:hypothetical protein n=1 Tax=Photobacterium damselae TaxID=38293 RepID=UPI00406824DD